MKNFRLKTDSQTISVLSFILLIVPGSMLVAAPDEKSENTIKYERDIAPLFARHCLDCHGPDLQESEFRVDLKSSLLNGGDSAEPSVVPFKPEASHLLQRVTTDDDSLRMPPEGEPLTKQEIGLLTSWIKEGATSPESGSDQLKLETDHWSFQPLQPVSPPEVNSPWAHQPLDAFVFEKLAEKQLTPAKSANRKDLMRRLYLVMLGLPPSPQEVRQFERDTRPDAYERLIEQVLDSPHYGERWARHWLDIVHFGETHGYETNRLRPNSWHYRDYVINSLNEDKPYDQFIKEQIAGDALGVDVGTGFLVAGPHDLVKSPDINLTLAQRQDDLTDMINTTGTTFLGLTLGCARCHNHKFDPITQKDFYSLQAVFAGVQHEERRVKFPAGSSEALKQVQLAQDLKTLEQKLQQAGARGPVNSRQNEERFAPVTTDKIRFTILATNNGAEPCLDELEVFSIDPQSGKQTNVALASMGTTLKTSGSLTGYPIHQLKHLNDGKHGNSFSWISNRRGEGWVELNFASPQSISRLLWGRDRQGRYQDRVAVDYKIEIFNPQNQKWRLVASSHTRLKTGDPDWEKADTSSGTLTEQQLEQLQVLAQEYEELKQQQDELQKQLPKMYIGSFQQPGATYRLYRGEPMAKREQVEPNTLAVLGTLGLDDSAPEQLRRLKLAEWIADSQNPLTARVIVNRLWQFHFGTGIVDTPSDFGENGTAPTHPELLDWLAGELLRHDWSLKHIHRLILTSNTWQQSSQPDQDKIAVDAGSRFLWRFPPRRLEAEIIRDSILSTSGVLNLERGGPGFSGFEIEPENVTHFHPKETFGPEDWRRMIYMTKIRQEQEAVFGAFDCPDASQVMPKRSRSTTPLQALNLYNSSFVLQQAEILSTRLQQQAPSKREDQVRLAFQLCFQREPTELEQQRTLAFVSEHGLSAVCRALYNSNEFLFIP